MNAEIKNGNYILYNDQPNLAGIEINYTGFVNINPTVPEGWICRASTNKILIINLGTIPLNVEQNLFQFTGTFNVNYAICCTSEAKQIKIKTKLYKRNWDSLSFHKSDYISLTEDWDKIKSTNKSSNKKHYSQIVSSNHIKQTNKLLTEEKPSSTPSATKTTRTTGGY